MEECDEISIKCNCLVESLTNIMNTQYFASTPLYEKNKKSFDTIILFIELSKDVVCSLCKIYQLYDINGQIKANGYRSIVRVFEKCIDRLMICSSKIKFNIPKLIYTSKDHLQNVIYWKKFLIFFYPIYCVALHIHKLNQEKHSSSLFLTKNSHLNSLSENLSIFLNKSFYGNNLAFQYSSKAQKLFNMLATMMVSFSSGFDHSSIKFVQNAIAFSKNGYYHLNPKLRGSKLLHLCTSPSIQFCKGFWSLMDDYGFQYLPALIGPSLRVNNTLSIKVKPLQVSPYVGEIPVTLFSDNDPALKYLPKRINTRLLSLSLYEGLITNNDISLYPIFDHPKPNSSSLIIHYHGGGFIARTTKSSEIYLRTWAESINVPIFSVDYSLSPEVSFPVAIEECFYAYCWAISNCHLLGFTGKNVVLVGDSAGANLVLGVVHKAIESGIRLPTGIVCLYPCTNMSFTISPSRLLSTIDILLGPGFLKACSSAYFTGQQEEFTVTENISQGSASRLNSNTRSFSDNIRDDNSMHYNIIKEIIDERALNYYDSIKKITTDSVASDSNNIDAISTENSNSEVLTFENSLASPIFTKPEILKKYPPTKIIVTSMDPLLDDGLEMANILLKNGVNVDVNIVEDLPHGFLEFSLIVPEAKIANQLVMKCIQNSLSTVFSDLEIV